MAHSFCFLSCQHTNKQNKKQQRSASDKPTAVKNLGKIYVVLQLNFPFQSVNHGQSIMHWGASHNICDMRFSEGHYQKKVDENVVRLSKPAESSESSQASRSTLPTVHFQARIFSYCLCLSHRDTCHSLRLFSYLTVTHDPLNLNLLGRPDSIYVQGGNCRD